jgi:hypothetical protein
MAVPGLLDCSIAAVGFVALFMWAPMVDVRTGRGYGLATLSSLLLACTIIVVTAVTIAAQAQPQPPSIHNLGVTILLVFYFVPAVYAMVFTLIGAVIVATKARHWRWIVGFVIAVLVPLLLAVPPHSFLVPINADYVVRQIGFLGILVAPEATVLAYSITRLVHPVTSAAAR